MSKKRETWYDKGFREAREGLSYDPPMHPKHKTYQDYSDGYADGERQSVIDEEEDGL